MGSRIEVSGIVGHNLNVLQVRGFAAMDTLSSLSIADEYDQALNPSGTQRDLHIPHARQIANYVRTIVEDTSRPGGFPEVILNVRKTEVIHKITRNEMPIDVEELQPGDFVSIQFQSDQVERLNQRFDPAISRVDGNHRLAAVEVETEVLAVWPQIPFALFIGLKKVDERSLFATINGNQRKMNTSHLSNIAASLAGDQLLLEPKSTPLWFAELLSEDGRVFSDRVYKGGSKQGLKEKYGFVPPLTLQQLKESLKLTLDELGTFLDTALEARHDAKNSEESAEALVKQAGELGVAIERYWIAVSKAFPDAWQENSGSKKFILFQSIGLNAFSRYAGRVILDLSKTGLTQENFDRRLEKLAHSFDIEKTNFEGIAGGGGAARVLTELLRALDSDDSSFRYALKNL
jgi:DGQHR domain-containing protein